MPGSVSRILVIDDDSNLSKLVVNILTAEGYECLFETSGEAGLKRLREGLFDLVMLDLMLPDIDGLRILREIRQDDNPESPQVVMISGEGSIKSALRATRNGAFDFLEKPLEAERIIVTVRNALEKGRMERTRNRYLSDMNEKYRMIAESPSMLPVLDLIEKAAQTECKILIEGENGTGKELVARSIHLKSARSEEAFIAVNCAAIPETLIESTLFGHKKGAFTNAYRDQIGRFQAADGGTLFLDEIGDMSLMLQAKLLRVLEDGTVEMVGSNTPVQMDVRLITATNRNLQKAMIDGTFREDLFYRLNVLSIKIPPLRDRKDDIPHLLNFYLERLCIERGCEPKSFTKTAERTLMTYHWPGNVRELRNLVEKTVTLTDGPVIDYADITHHLKRDGDSFFQMKSGFTLRQARREFERSMIKKTIKECGGNITLASKILDVPRTYLYKKMKNLGMKQ